MGQTKGLEDIGCTLREMIVLLEGTVMHRLITGIYSEKCVIRLFPCHVNVTEHTYTNLDGVAYYTPKLYGIGHCSQTTRLYSTLLYKTT